ncbi:hypothetical protein SELMODRAFT_439712 [Selaginella moellendorffii]|uniref:Uncharacterized protein n=1 Tax=Selaginella moellendorffii TaxID=88036 RepID=D8R5A7_SELML|nr:peroxisomal fatty acid beta-oxidation multifunctional protein AIM1 isoform X1 [Selaginella moellendorffii]EFJ32812.1 hypothetical protein SELMODRAFT_439712 [Selaginella moellendorffii]|eukprot:XP_002966785.1 peroxisomal fatty acid beta-oxidation multifunctional protein AIM1 isoform X1 [Selaginella moellendorffii]
MEDASKVRLEVGGDGVALLVIDNPPVNSLSAQVMGELAEKFIEAHERADVQAIVLTGANNKFSGGADIKSMSKAPGLIYSCFLSIQQPTGGIVGAVRKTEVSGLVLMNDIIEGGSKPAVAAIHGFALGGGLELAMACHARVASPDARLGLPELQLGIIPGLGGTQRLPRLVGVGKAVEMMMTSKMIKAKEAHEAGLVDAICDYPQLIQFARNYAKGIANKTHPFLKTLERSDKLEPLHKALHIIANARLRAKKTHKHVEYPFICLAVIEHGIHKGGIEGTIFERKMGVQTVDSLPAKALMHIFLAERTVYKVPNVSDGRLEARPVKTVGVIGGGLMGSGIATALIVHNVRVLLKEVDEERLQAGINRVQANLKSRVSKGSMSQAEFQRALGLLVGTVDYKGFESANLVIEAVIESIPLKKKIFGELDAICSRDCILASNTSSCDLNEITDGVSFRDRIIGAHFFSPAHVMRLLEIVRTDSTSHQSICDLLALSKKIGKVPVVVQNAVGFAVNRVFFPYHRIAAFLVDLGVHPYRIDAVIKDFGMPIGPFRLGDLAGLQIGALVADTFEKEFGDRLYPSYMGTLMAKANRTGEATGKGYYNYHGTRQEHPAPELDEILEESRKLAGLNARGLTAEGITDKDIVEMIFFPIVNEACRVIDEKIVIRASDLDVASVLGMGFPAFRGGIAFWGHTVGLHYILVRLQQWHSHYGSIFRPTSSLHKLAATKSMMLAHL